MAVKKKFTTIGKGSALGRGLDALISTESVHTEGSSIINEIPIAEIEPNPNQPRRDFDETALAELAASIKEIGIIQPITLHQVAANRYQIIAGERRWRASQMAGLTTVPAYIRTLNQASIMEMALVENLQREDLNAIEVALAYQQLMDADGMTQEKVSQRVGKSRAAVTNYLRLLRLPAQVQMALQKKELDMGHARALLAIDSPSQQVKLFKDIVAHGYSVRKVEEMVQNIKNGDTITPSRKPGKQAEALSAEYADFRSALAKSLGANVQMSVNGKGKGKISISFNNASELEKVMAVLGKC